MMDQLIKEFSAQIREAIDIARKAKVKPHNFPITQVVVTGLGGSGIGGDLAAEFAGDELRVPFIVNKDYFLPAFVNKNSLVIASSYSGNTEETLKAFHQAMARKAKVVCISSGGKLLELAAQHKVDFIAVPGGNPPRACLGYSLVQQLYVLHYLMLIPDTFEADLLAAVELLDNAEQQIQEEAKKIAAQLKGKIPVIYTTTPMASVAVRFRQQLNENSKMLAWHHVIPEMNHNELVGWREKRPELGVIFLRNNNDYPRNQQRIEISKEIISKYCDTILDIYSKGNSNIERALYLIHLTDWVSYYLAEIRNMDAVEVQVIDFLKGSLSKQPIA
ncbi:MAG: bifunctional phosphoglucose/phosphomannose isomerase [Chitinophagales bacterium]|nr:MAG: bifunctional phosphoglucose/phosphomannose isomerase [Chitinophagales bacterium]